MAKSYILDKNKVINGIVAVLMTAVAVQVFFSANTKSEKALSLSFGLDKKYDLLEQKFDLTIQDFNKSIVQQSAYMQQLAMSIDDVNKNLKKIHESVIKLEAKQETNR